MNHRSRLLFVLLIALSPAPAAWADIIHVDAGAAGNDDGSSWDHAFNDLQNALAAANPGDEIRVAAGMYTPTDTADRIATFQLLDDVAIYGGFPEGGGAWQDRDWQAHLTVLSGDLGGTNSYHVVTGSGTDESAVLDGFHITAGLANGSSPHHRGGGLYNDSGSPTLTNVGFSGNEAFIGGGMYNKSNSNPTLTNVSFSGNQANTSGGGTFNQGNSNPTLSNVSYSGNRADYGGGMYNNSSNPILTNVSFSGNLANDSGGGMYNRNSSPTLTNSLFWNNQSGADTNTPSASVFNDNSTPTFTWSLAANCNPAGSWESDCGTDGGNNLPDADPLFIDPPDPADAPTTAGNPRPQTGSPAVDAGDPATDPGLFSGGPGDLDNNPRFVGDTIDLGPFEFQPALTFDPAALTFGEVFIGQSSAPAVVTLQNTGAAVEAVDYEINAPFVIETNDCGAELPADSSCQITVVFTPFSAGELSGSVEASYPGGVLAVLELTGTGVAPDNGIFADRFE